MRKNKDGTIDISIITVNYNGFDDTCQMIESIQKHIKSASYEIIVVDNASKKNEALLLRKRYPFIQAIRSTTNRGFAGGNNFGVNIAQGKYLFFLNNDTIIKDDCFHFLIDTLESDKQIGGVSPMICYADNNSTIQYAGFTPLSLYTLRNHSIGNGKPVSEKYQRKRIVPYLHGAAMIIKREVYTIAGAMPEMYFLYYEELDWSTAIARHGYALYYDPRCIVYHKESQSTGQASPLRAFYMTRNRLLYAYRNRMSKYRWRCYLYQLFVVTPRDIFKYLFQLRFDLIKATLSGIYAYFKLSKQDKSDKPYVRSFAYFLP